MTLTSQGSRRAWREVIFGAILISSAVFVTVWRVRGEPGARPAGLLILTPGVLEHLTATVVSSLYVSSHVNSQTALLLPASGLAGHESEASIPRSLIRSVAHRILCSPGAW